MMWQKEGCIMYEIFFVNFWVTILCPVFIHYLVHFIAFVAYVLLHLLYLVYDFYNNIKPKKSLKT